MDVLDWITAFAGWLTKERLLLLAIPVPIVMYFLGKREELGWNAIQNTSATILVMVINYAVMITCHKEINAVAQAGYDALNIPRLPADFWATTPLWATSILALAAKDLADYTIHRLMHSTRWLWPAHAAHHSDTHVNVFTTFRVHYFEVMLMSFTYIIMLTWLQMPEVIPIATTLSLAHNMYVHLNVGWTHGPLRYVIASPAFHRWHHADAPEAYGKNLANIFSFYDVIFGTFYMPRPCDKPMGALSSGIEDKNPILIWLYPFQEWARLVRETAAGLVARRTARSGDAAEERPRLIPGE